MARILHVNKRFEGQTIRLTGQQFENCHFINCVLEVSNEKFGLKDCDFTDCYWRLQGLIICAGEDTNALLQIILMPGNTKPAKEEYDSLADAIYRQIDGRVHDGPFAGMKYGRESLGSPLIPKLLGLYEKELWPIIQEIIRRSYRKIVNIGAGEGYYSVGLAMRMPAAQVVSFETEPLGQRAIQQTAQWNGVTSRIQVYGQCTPQLLAAQMDPGQHTLIVCDVEGAEEELLDIAAIPRLGDADILVELHDFERPGIGQRFRQRFGATHAITEICSVERSPEDWPSGIKIGGSLRRLVALREYRPWPMEWFWMESRHSPARSVD